ncbi:hypothetical protein GDO86_016686 [Hymenochirus boettgeri]|uniref:Uncharacterized protein n=1 Tax=Hymenochirus boettgeri TaxID=247094 RepID=A0A8T2IM43_9PIPI|nr:hypothetical protein GDO86_016686 [Hymenochirus boettgeri]
MLVFAFKSAYPNSSSGWLNHYEDEATSHQTNLQYLNQAVLAHSEYLCESPKRPLAPIGHKRKRTEQELGHTEDKSLPTSPYGPCLIPVLPKTKQGPGVFGKVSDGAGLVESNTEEKSSSLQSGQITPPAEPSRTITSDQVLDCFVNPQVVRLVSRLLLQKQP